MFQGWNNVFALMGGAAGSLIGLLFVVVTLTSGQDRARTLRAGGIYLSPNIGHFAVVLTACVTAVAPGLSPPLTAIVVAMAALFGLVAAVRACLGILEFSRSGDPPHWSDFWYYGVAPAVIYLALEAVAAETWTGASWAPRALAALLMILMLVAIRNAWDLITWMVTRPTPPPEK